MKEDILDNYTLSVMDNGNIIRIMIDIIRSPAFKKLTANSIRIYLGFLAKRKIPASELKKSRKRNHGSSGRQKHIKFKNGNIVYPYKKLMEEFKIHRSTVRDSIDQLIKYGFIDINHHGGGCDGDVTTYFISERWRGYDSDNFQHRKREKDIRGIGFTKKNWEDRTGRERKQIKV
jgi:hypothetical protein